MHKQAKHWVSRVALGTARGSVIGATVLAVTATTVVAQDMRMAGAWVLEQSAPNPLTTLDGRPAPYTDAARQLLAERMAQGTAGDAVETDCLPPGIPRLMTTNVPFKVLITPAKVTMLHEFQHTIRHIPLDEFMPSDEDIDPFFGGTSIGRWEGNTLVVQTGRFNDMIRLDAAGSPQSSQAKITERFTVSDDGKTLENIILVEDSENYTAPWTTKLVYSATDVPLHKEDICAYRLLAPSLRDRIETR